jgi:hypothetical protein
MEVADCEALRRELKPLAERVRALYGTEPQVPEAMANVMLAYRHLEDASLRLGKAIQALDGGVSVYDKTQVPSSVTTQAA